MTTDNDIPTPGKPTRAKRLLDIATKVPASNSASNDAYFQGKPPAGVPTELMIRGPVHTSGLPPEDGKNHG